ncbi:hypothetical protein D030_1380B, partial [Vibrio parahaemolyticus AQ3810]
LPPS